MMQQYLCFWPNKDFFAPRFLSSAFLRCLSDKIYAFGHSFTFYPASSSKYFVMAQDDFQNYAITNVGGQKPSIFLSVNELISNSIFFIIPISSLKHEVLPTQQLLSLKGWHSKAIALDIFYHETIMESTLIDIIQSSSAKGDQ